MDLVAWLFPPLSLCRRTPHWPQVVPWLAWVLLLWLWPLTTALRCGGPTSLGLTGLAWALLILLGGPAFGLLFVIAGGACVPTCKG